jgi:hypothetical protein
MRRRSAALLLPIAFVLSVSPPPATADLPSTPRVAAAGVSTKGEVPASTIKPARLKRGQDPSIPQLLGTTILDGSLRIEVPAREVQLLGKSGREYVVATWSRSGRAQVERVGVDGARETILDHINGDLDLSVDGQQLFEAVVRTESHTVVTVRDAHSGDRLARRTFRGFVSVLDADEERAVLGAWSPSRTFWWHTRTNRTRRIAGMAGYFADIRASRFATLTADAYAGGCSRLSPLSTPSKLLWRSCRQAVTASSPSGHRLLTQYLLADGPMGTAQVHGDHGRLIARYRTPGWFGPATWESNRSLLMLTNGTRKTAVVRCKSGTCERASKLVDTP